jgi:hypothetical protein
MRKFAGSLALSLVLFSAGCSPRDFLTRRLAGDLIAGSDVFKAPQQFWLRTGVVSNKEYSSPEYLVLRRHGWITVSGTSCGANPGPPPCWEVILTPLGVDTLRDWVPKKAATSQYFSVPVARRALTGITGIHRMADRADVEFQWKWAALNEVGAALYAGSMEYNSTVEFVHYDDGWRVVEGSAPKNNQGLDEALKNGTPTQ